MSWIHLVVVMSVLAVMATGAHVLAYTSPALAEQARQNRVAAADAERSIVASPARRRERRHPCARPGRRDSAGVRGRPRGRPGSPAPPPDRRDAAVACGAPRRRRTAPPRPAPRLRRRSRLRPPHPWCSLPPCPSRARTAAARAASSRSRASCVPPRTPAPPPPAAGRRDARADLAVRARAAPLPDPHPPLAERAGGAAPSGRRSRPARPRHAAARAAGAGAARPSRAPAPPSRPAECSSRPSARAGAPEPPRPMTPGPPVRPPRPVARGGDDAVDVRDRLEAGLPQVDLPGDGRASRRRQAAPLGESPPVRWTLMSDPEPPTPELVASSAC